MARKNVNIPKELATLDCKIVRRQPEMKKDLMRSDPLCTSGGT
jgi:hypothetical protein